MSNGSKYKMSRERLKEINEELHYLETVRAKEVSELIREARSFGDLSENSEYDEAKTEQGKLYSKIAELKNIIENAEIIEKKGKNANHIGIGNLVKVKSIESGENEEYWLVGSQEANPMKGRISDDSPFGRSLIGKSVGNIITVEAPAGALKFEILSIENQN